VPDVGRVVDVLPPIDAGKEGVHQREPLHFLRKLGGIGVGDHQPDVVADHACLRHPKRLRKGVNADGRRLHVEAVGGNHRVADTGKIGGDDGEVGCEERQERSPHA
jgi:hypothetical protein